MFLPLFIAILLGLATPTNTNQNCHNGGTVVNTNDTDPNNPGDPETDPGDGIGEGGDTGGETGHVPPIKPPKPL